MGFIFSLLSGGVLEGVYKLVVGPFLQAYLKSKDVDLEKFKVTSANSTELAVAVLDANVKFASIKAGYALSVLQWWPFRLILFMILLVASTRFCLIMIDSTWWWIEGCTINGKHIIGDACSWSFPALGGNYGRAEFEYILFFVIAKPVDSAVTGTIGLVSKYLGK